MKIDYGSKRIEYRRKISGKEFLRSAYRRLLKKIKAGD